MSEPQEQKAISQPISFWPEDLDYLKRRAQYAGISLSAVVRQLVRADRAAHNDLHDVHKATVEPEPSPA